MKYAGVILPITAWVLAGTLKFFINYCRFGKQAVSKIGYGGFPSTHTSVASSAVMYCGFRQGFDDPVFTIGLAFLLLIMIDAMGIRRTVGIHAQTLNKITKLPEKLRESQGHHLYEVLGGLGVGTILGYLANYLR